MDRDEDPSLATARCIVIACGSCKVGEASSENIKDEDKGKYAPPQRNTLVHGGKLKGKSRCQPAAEQQNDNNREYALLLAENLVQESRDLPLILVYPLLVIENL